MLSKAVKYRYRVNAADELEWVDRLWIAFAEENGAAELTPSSVLGHCLWDFLADEETRNCYRDIHKRVRASGKSVVLPFRCDSPSLQRFMRMTIRAAKDGALMYESQLLRVEPQRSLNALDATTPRSHAVLTMCSCCKRALVEPAGWLEMEDVSARLKLAETPKVPELRYTTCPDCAHALEHAGVS